MEGGDFLYRETKQPGDSGQTPQLRRAQVKQREIATSLTETARSHRTFHEHANIEQRTENGSAGTVFQAV